MKIIEQWDALGRPARIALMLAAVAAAMLLPELALLVNLGGIDLGALMLLSALSPLLARLERAWAGACDLVLQAQRGAQASLLATPAGFGSAAGTAMLAALLVDGLLPGLMFWMPMLLQAA